MAQVASTTAAQQATTSPIAEASTAQTPAAAETSTTPAAQTSTTSEAQTSTSEAATSSAAQSTSTSSAQPTTSSSSTAASTSSTTTSSAAPSTSVVVVTPSSSSTTSTSSSTEASSSSSTGGTSTEVVTLTSAAAGTVPGYVTTTRRVASSSSASSGSKSGSSSSFPVGGIVGVVVGSVAVLAVIGFFITRSMRKRARAKRTAARSSMFEPWTTAPAIEDEPYEKPAYDNPEPSYPMTHAGIGAYGAFGHESTPYDAARSPYQLDDYNQQYATDPAYDQYGAPMAGVGAAGAASAAGAAGAAAVATSAAAQGLHDGMMVRVKVGFVRSLEDELAVVPGQQLFLHNAYDDGWSLCEDQAQNRGVVPVSCLEPWDETAEQPVHDDTIPAEDTANRRSSLHANQQ